MLIKCIGTERVLAKQIFLLWTGLWAT